MNASHLTRMIIQLVYCYRNINCIYPLDNFKKSFFFLAELKMQPLKFEFLFAAFRVSN